MNSPAIVGRVIVNELGNTIPIAVTCDQRGVTVTASGPTSEVEHTWTPMEAATIRDLLGYACAMSGWWWMGTWPMPPGYALSNKAHDDPAATA